MVWQAWGTGVHLGWQKRVCLVNTFCLKKNIEKKYECSKTTDTTEAGWLENDVNKAHCELQQLLALTAQPSNKQRIKKRRNRVTPSSTHKNKGSEGSFSRPPVFRRYFVGFRTGKGTTVWPSAPSTLLTYPQTNTTSHHLAQCAVCRAQPARGAWKQEPEFGERCKCIGQC